MGGGGDGWGVRGCWVGGVGGVGGLMVGVSGAVGWGGWGVCVGGDCLGVRGCWVEGWGGGCASQPSPAGFLCFFVVVSSSFYCAGLLACWLAGLVETADCLVGRSLTYTHLLECHRYSTHIPQRDIVPKDLVGQLGKAEKVLASGETTATAKAKADGRSSRMPFDVSTRSAPWGQGERGPLAFTF